MIPKLLTPSAVAESASIFSEARRSRQLLDALPDRCRPLTLEDANAIQMATAERLGDAIAGWKVGATPEGRVARGVLLRSIGDNITLMPPLTITSSELHRVVHALSEAIDEVAGHEGGT